MAKLSSLILSIVSFSTSLLLLGGCTNMVQRLAQAQPKTVSAQSTEPGSAPKHLAHTKLPLIAFTPGTQAWMDRAIASSATVAIAQARMEEAQAQSRSVFGVLLPELSATLGASDGRQRAVAIEPPVETDLPVRNERRQGSFEFRWELDIFGANRARNRAAASLVRAAFADLTFARQSLAAQLQQTLVRRTAAISRVAYNQRLIAVLNKIDLLEQALADTGIRSRADWLRVRADLQARQNDAERDQLDLEAQTLRLRALSDSPRAEIERLLANEKLPNCPVDAEFSLPLQALAARPDVSAAQWRLRAAFNDADAAQLDRLPNLTLTGSSGSSRQESTDLFSTITRSFEHSFGLSIAQKLFAGGRIQANVDAARARGAQQTAQYREVLLLAAEEVDLAIASARQSSRSASRLDAALLDSEQLRALSQARLQAGIDSQLDRALVERDYLERALAALDGQRERCVAAISVRRALASVWPDPNTKNLISQQKVGPNRD